MPKTKSGEQITWKEFRTRWKSGMMNLTPQQKVANEFSSTVVMFVGFIVSLFALVIFRDRFPVSWLTYGLILIFAGNAWGTLIKCVGLYAQKKFFKNIDSQIDEGERDEERIMRIAEDTKGPEIKGGPNPFEQEEPNINELVVEKEEVVDDGK